MNSSVLWSLLATATNGAYVALLFVGVAALTDIQSLGEFSWAFQLWMLLVLIGNFGGQTAAMVLAARLESPSAELWSVCIRIAFRWGLLVTVLVCVAVGAVSPLTDDSRVGFTFVLALSIPAQSVGRSLSGYVVGNGKIGLFSAWVFARATLALALPLSVLWWSGDVLWLCGLLCTAEWIATALLLWRTWPTAAVSSPERSCRRSVLEGEYRLNCRQLGWNSIVAEMSARIDLIIAGFVLSSADVGVYSLISTFGKMPLMVGQSFLRLLIPYFVSRHAFDVIVREHASATVDKIVAVLMLGAVLVFAAGLCFPNVISQSGFDDRYLVYSLLLYAVFSFQASFGSIGAIFIAWGRADLQLLRQMLLLGFSALFVFFGGTIGGLKGTVFGIAAAFFVHVALMPVFARVGFGLRGLGTMGMSCLVKLTPVFLGVCWLGCRGAIGD